MPKNLELKFPAPGRPLSINQANSMHWAAKRRALAPWREAIAAAWEECENQARVKDVSCEVQVILPFPDIRRRDPHNYVGTMCKALVDELVKGGCWPDDNPDWVTVSEPILVQGYDCIVRLVPKEK